MKTAFLLISAAVLCPAQTLSPHWEELTGPDFIKAIAQSQGVCLVPFGIIEKHGPTGPTGTDLINIRYATFNAVKEEFAVVFPEYYFGQIAEAEHQPGTISYSENLQLQLLQETTQEMARNGCRKIVIVNGHGGNNSLLAFFVHSQVHKAHGYVVYGFSGLGVANPSPAAAPSRPGVDGHAGEGEISNVMASRPELVHTDRAGTESGANRNRLDLPAGVQTGISWYSMYPDHYSGDAAGATAARGQAAMADLSKRIAAVIRAVRADETSLRLQTEFQGLATHPLDTKQ